MKLLTIVLSIIGCVAASASIDNGAGDAPLLHVRVDELPKRELHMYTARAANMKRQEPSFTTYGDAVNFVNNLQQTPGTSNGDGSSLPWGSVKKCSSAASPATCATCAIASNIVYASATILCGVRFSAGPGTPLAKGTNIGGCVVAATRIWYVSLGACLNA